MQSWKKFIHAFNLIVTILVMAFSFASPAMAQIKPAPTGAAALPKYSGVDETIKEYLCTPETDSPETVLVDCLNKVYRFGVAIGAIALVFFFVLAGYYYIVGGEQSKEKGKTIFTSSLIGMVIILTSYVLLSFINPGLIEFKPIQPPIFIDPKLPGCGDVGFGEKCLITLPDGSKVPGVGDGNGGGVPSGGGGRRCSPASSGPGSISGLANSCFAQHGVEVVRQASVVANAESGGNPALPVSAGSCGAGKRPARCTGGEIPVWGLFQINLTVHQVGGLNCPAAFGNKEWTCSKTCTVTDKNLYNKCVEAAKNATYNTNAACKISQDCLKSGRPRFCAWGNTSNEHGKRCGF